MIILQYIKSKEGERKRGEKEKRRRGEEKRRRGIL
jgi:hypothetical protein